MKKSFFSYIFLVTVLLLNSCGTPAAPTEAQIVPTEQHVMTEMPVNTEVSAQPVEESTVVPIEGQAFIDITGFRFNPGSVTIKAGTTVTWTNKGVYDHTVSSDDGLFSGSLSEGGLFSFTFNETGNYPFHCDIHHEMKGVIVVVE